MFGAGGGDVRSPMSMMAVPAGSSRVFVTNLSELETMEHRGVDEIHGGKIPGSTCSMTSLSLSKGFSSSMDKHDFEVKKNTKKHRKSRRKGRRHRRQKRLGDAAQESDSSREHACVLRRCSRSSTGRSSLITRSSTQSYAKESLRIKNKSKNDRSLDRVDAGVASTKCTSQQLISTQQAQQQKKQRAPRSPGHDRQHTFLERLMEVFGNLNNASATDANHPPAKKPATGCAPFLFSSCMRQQHGGQVSPLGSFFSKDALTVFRDEHHNEDNDDGHIESSHAVNVHKSTAAKVFETPLTRKKAGTHTTEALTSASSSFASTSSLRNDVSQYISVEVCGKDHSFNSLSRTLSSPLPPTCEEVHEESSGVESLHVPNLPSQPRTVTPLPMCSSVGTNDMQLSIIPSGEECDTSSESTRSRHTGVTDQELTPAPFGTLLKVAPPPVFTQHYDEAVKYESRGMLQEALHTYGAALTTISSMSSSESGLGSPESFNSTFSAERAMALHRMGVVQWKAGLYRGALSSLHGALDAHKSKQECNLMDLAETLHQIGAVHASMGNYKEAMQSLKNSLCVRRKALGNSHQMDDIHIAKTLVAMGSVHEECARFKRATLCFERALKVQKLELGESHVDVAATMSKLGVVYEKMGNLQVAMCLYDEALFAYRVRLGHLHVDVAVALCNVGRIHELWGDFDRAGRSYEEARQIFIKCVGRYHRNVGTVLYNLGVLNCRRGWYDRGIAAHTEACNVQRLALGEHHPDVAVTMEAMAKAYVMMGRHAEASGLFSSVLQLRKSLYGANHILVAMTLEGMGQTLLDYAARTAASSSSQLDIAGASGAASFYYVLEARKLSKEALLLYQCNDVSMDHPRMKELMERIDNVARFAF